MGLALVGCSADAGTMVPPVGNADAASLAFVDSTTLMPLTDGGQAQIIHGPQGGYHIVVSLLAKNVWPGTAGIPGSPDNPTTTLHAFRADGSELTLALGNTSVLKLALEPLGGASYLLRERQLRLDTTTPASLNMESLRISADLVDRDGKSAHDEKHVVALKPVN